MTFAFDILTFVKRIFLSMLPSFEDALFGSFCAAGGFGLAGWVSYYIIMHNVLTIPLMIALIIAGLFFGWIGTIAGGLVGLIIIWLAEVVIVIAKKIYLHLDKEWSTHIVERQQERILIRERNSNDKAGAGALSITEKKQAGELTIDHKIKIYHNI